MTSIPLFSYLEQYQSLKQEMREAIERVLGSGRLILGPEVEAFERAFAEYLGTGGACVGVNSGTDALVIALLAVGVRPGDEVVTVSNTAVPTVSAIRTIGACPVFCDVDPITCLLDIEDLQRRITQKTRAVIPVHLFGNVVDVPRIMRLLSGRSIWVIEDCAQAHGATLHGRMAGTMGHAAAFSFYPTKNLGAYGEAGICYSANDVLVREMRRIRMYGFDGQYYSEREGLNSRLDELQAAILRVKLRFLDTWIARRRTLAALYDGLLLNEIERVPAAEGVCHSFHLFVVKVNNRDRLREAILERGIGCGIHYPFPIHTMRGYAALGYHKGSLPITESLAERILSLPMYPELSEESVERACKEIASTCGRLL